jgi:hypothetical protein
MFPHENVTDSMNHLICRGIAAALHGIDSGAMCAGLPRAAPNQRAAASSGGRISDRNAASGKEEGDGR